VLPQSMTLFGLGFDFSRVREATSAQTQSSGDACLRTIAILARTIECKARLTSVQFSAAVETLGCGRGEGLESCDFVFSRP